MLRGMLAGVLVLGVAGVASAGGADQCVALRSDIGTLTLTVPHVGKVQVRPGTLGITTGFHLGAYAVRWERGVLVATTGDEVADVPDPVRPYQHLADSDTCPSFIDY
jgi:hypothetical protein